MKKRLKITLSAVLFIFLLAAAFSFAALPINAENLSGTDYDELSVDPTGEKEGFSAVLYNNENGLPTSEANAIAETGEGFIWIGGYSGLVRYDGNTFERIDSTTGITSVVSLYVDSKNRLWIGTNDNGTVKMENGEFTRYHHSGGMTSSSIRCICEDKNGIVYIATTHGIGTFDENEEMSVLNETQINDEYIRDLRAGADGTIYGLTQNGAIFTIVDRKLTGFYDGSRLGIEDIKSILPDSEDPEKIYVGTRSSKIYHAVLKNGMKEPEVLSVSPLNTVNSMEIINDELWVCADNGIGAFINGKFEQIENIHMNNSIDSMMVDYEGNLWFTSSRQGVLKIVPNRFADLYDRYNLPENVVNSTCMYKSQLYIGTDSGLTVIANNGVASKVGIKKTSGIADEKLKKSTNLIDLLDGIRIRSIIHDSKNRLWFSTYSDLGLVCYDTSNESVRAYTIDDGLPSDRVRVVFERSDGKIMAACTGGIAVIGNNGIEDVYNEQSGLSNPEILTISEAANGDAILGSDGDGIYILNDHGVKNVGEEDGLSSEVVLRIKRDEKRNLFWVVTSNSLGYMTDDYKVTTIEKFPYSNNFDMIENGRGEMWVLSSNGVYVVSADELLANGEINPVYYNRANGLSVVSTANSYSDITPDGNLYIAGTTGVSKVNIEKDFEEVTNTKMAVPFIDADGQTIMPNEDGTFIVPAYTKRVTLYDYVYTYSLTNPQVTYWLEGFDKNKTTVSRTDLEPVAYTNLHGGKYTFHMLLQDSHGQAGNEISVPIQVEKTIYEKWWFRIFAVITAICLLIGFALLFNKKRIDALLKKQEENKIFTREVIEAFARTIDMKDAYTKGHSTRVAEYTAMLARELGYDEETVEKYRNIALLHDIGKIGVRPEVLNKPGKLEESEFNEIKSHSHQGYLVLKDISLMPELAVGAESHHERPDGKGYPKGLTGDKIPRVAQIIAVADTFDAMYSDRPYRKRMNFEKAVSIIKEVSGTQLTPDVVDAFLRLVERGEFRAADDTGGGSTEDINNIHKRQNEESGKDKPAEGNTEPKDDGTKPEEADTKPEGEGTKPEEGNTKPEDGKTAE